MFLPCLSLRSLTIVLIHSPSNLSYLLQCPLALALALPVVLSVERPDARPNPLLIR